MVKDINITLLREVVEKKRQEMIWLTQKYRLTSPEVVQASQELDKLLNMLGNREEVLQAI
ncbi:aspartyl-phosphate phosphatase Spo0E family protein [Bacillus cereus]|uniref:aspartyl-phosphate phosphatase Spo0E family protein n=1 Tax=Bacillus cereus group TaxID=86661 RepID=UPI00101EEA54|nr:MULTISPECIES: aspartyl-phosphate phosphatase Spo0E family protein [Bacillus cereus group]MCU5571083.1 aspartyl-phosphate phosphatase Spo0E family protein [Bacillus cereus]MDO6632795.1 aspartyl-phosphate phosphatase Spo0E family protein [Bacillus thuringiensis]MDO6662150.1 aspartyl-phosphate phosphatase Spo0E family protein [Bacillus thuringiensis]MDO6702990.1 aspartyl-phosphate phosphatase Spo0E family protein [Bacillus thuringiensis]